MKRRGIALVAALLALLLAGAMASAALAVAHLHWRAGLGQLAAARANARVLLSLEQRLVTWNSAWADSLPIALDVSLGGATGPGFRMADTALRLGSALFQLRSTAEEYSADGGLLARDGAAILIALGPPEFRDTAAIVSNTTVALSGDAKVTGGDHIPPGWDSLCPPLDLSAVAQIVESDPFLRFAPGIDTALRPTAGIVLGGAINSPGPRLLPDGSCDLTPLNWGDPAPGPCAGLRPVVVLNPGARVVDGIGSGVLLALGDIELSGDFYFTGVMLAKGRVRFGGRAHLVGGLVALDGVELSAMAKIDHSTCAISRALEAQRVAPRRIPGGGWRLW